VHALRFSVSCLLLISPALFFMCLVLLHFTRFSFYECCYYASQPFVVSMCLLLLPFTRVCVFSFSTIHTCPTRSTVLPYPARAPILCVCCACFSNRWPPFLAIHVFRLFFTLLSPARIVSLFLCRARIGVSCICALFMSRAPRCFVHSCTIYSLLAIGGRQLVSNL
jgi:hypothetical protein